MIFQMLHDDCDTRFCEFCPDFYFCPYFVDLCGLDAASEGMLMSDEI